MRRHEHDFEHCGYDEQQCDTDCRVNWHKCSICKKSRAQVAKDVEDVRAHVEKGTKAIIKGLRTSLKAPTLIELVEDISEFAKLLNWLSKEQLVELAIEEENR